MPDPQKPSAPASEETPPPTAPEASDTRRQEDEALDEALEETFPASDPVSTLRDD